MESPYESSRTNRTPRPRRGALKPSGYRPKPGAAVKLLRATTRSLRSAFRCAGRTGTAWPENSPSGRDQERRPPTWRLPRSKSNSRRRLADQFPWVYLPIACRALHHRGDGGRVSPHRPPLRGHRRQSFLANRHHPPLHQLGRPRPDHMRARAEEGLLPAGMKIIFALLCQPALAGMAYRQIGAAAQVALGSRGAGPSRFGDPRLSWPQRKRRRHARTRGRTPARVGRSSIPRSSVPSSMDAAIPPTGTRFSGFGPETA